MVPRLRHNEGDMRRSHSLTLAHVFGIRVGAAPSWFLFLGLTIVFLYSTFQSWLDGAGSSTVFAVAVIAAFGFSASIALHELGHALVARRLGIEVHGIDLWVLGGFTHMGREVRSPGEELKVATAGPIVNLVLMGLFLLATALLVQAPMSLGDAIGGMPTTSAPLVVCAWLTLVNGGLLLFNLLPAYPLDGGRIAQALVWRATGSRGRATRVSGLAGRALGQLLAVGGVILIWRRDALTGASLLVLGMFIAQAARGALLSGTFSERIEGVTAADVMDADPQTIDAEATTTAALERFAELAGGLRALPVVGPGRRFVGLLSRDRLEHTLADGRPMLTAAEMLAGEDPDGGQVGSDASLESLLHGDRLGRYGLVPVVDADGTFRGVVTIDHVRRALRV